MNYTTIDHDVRMKFGLSCNDYCIADKIYHLANNPKNDSRWCYAGREAIGRMFGISRQSVITIIKTLVAKNLVEIHPETDHLRTTETWYRNFTPCKESLHPPVKKVDSKVSNNFTPPCKETLRPSYNKSLEEEIEPTNAGEPAGEGEISKSKKPAKFNPLTVSLPFPSPAFKQAWADWITHLGEKRKPPTEKSTELQLKKLGKFSEAVAVAMINQSIEKGWQGLFDLKAEDLPRPTTPPPPDTQIDLPPDAALEQTRRKSHYENFVFGFPEYTGKKIDFPESLSVHHLPKGYYHDLRK